MTHAGELLASLSCDRPGCPCRRSVRAGHGLTHCPAHDDEHPSLNVDEKNGIVLWSCKAGCANETVTGALKERKLLGTEPASRNGTVRRSRTPFDICDVNGNVVARHIRIELLGGKKKFEWEMPDGGAGLRGMAVADLPLYGYELLAQKPDRPVVISEGEKAAGALRDHGILSLGTVTGAAITPSLEALRPLQGRLKVVLWPDNDDSGRRHMNRLGERLSQLEVPTFVVEWAEAPEKGDAADYMAEHSKDDLQELLRAARPWQPAATDVTPQIGLRVELTNPRIWHLKLPDMAEIRLKTAELSQWPLVEQACLEQVIRMPSWRPRNRDEWARVLDRLVDAADTQESPPELTNQGRVVELLKQFFGHSFDRLDALLKSSAYRDEKGVYLFKMVDFLRHVDRVGVKDLPDPLVWDVVRKLGGTEARKRVGGKHLRVVSLPAAAVEETPEEIALEDDEDGI